jgi:hypothetical protein
MPSSSQPLRALQIDLGLVCAVAPETSDEQVLEAISAALMAVSSSLLIDRVSIEARR